MFNKIETVEIFFPNRDSSFYKIGKALEIPVKQEGLEELFYIKTSMFVKKITVSRLFKVAVIHLSNGQKIKYYGIGFAITSGGYSDEIDRNVEEKK